MECGFDAGLYLDSFTIQQVRTVLPLPYSVNERIIQPGAKSFDDTNIDDLSSLADHCTQLDVTFDSSFSRDGQVIWLCFFDEVPRRDSTRSDSHGL